MCNPSEPTNLKPYNIFLNITPCSPPNPSSKLKLVPANHTNPHHQTHRPYTILKLTSLIGSPKQIDTPLPYPIPTNEMHKQIDGLSQHQSQTQNTIPKSCQSNRKHKVGFRVQDLGFRVQGFRVQGLGFRVQGLGFRVQGLGLGFQGLGLRVKVYNLFLGFVQSLGFRFEGLGIERIWS